MSNPSKISLIDSGSSSDGKIPAIVILGPTATGKTGISIELAKWLREDFQLGAEIISADSRQVYKGLDIGTGKVTSTEMRGIPHHLLDIRDPAISTERYSVADFTKDSLQLVHDIHSRGAVPIICGGTGFYIESLVLGLEYPELHKENYQPRDEDLNGGNIQDKTTEELFEKLKSIDPERAIGIDPKNRRRVERALSIAMTSGQVPKLASRPPTDIDFLLMGITADPARLRENIKHRLHDRLSAGMIEEVHNLHKNGLSYDRTRELGLEYRYVADFLQGRILTKTELETILEQKIWQYSKRQRTWFARDNSMNRAIKWFEVTAEKPVDLAGIEKLVAKFLNLA